MSMSSENWNSCGQLKDGRNSRRKIKRSMADSFMKQFAEPLEGRVLLTTIYVDANPEITTHDGLSWDTAYADLQPVLMAASAGTTIMVADGTYKPTTTTDRSISFQLKDGVSLLGGYAGYGAADPNARDLTLYSTILSGDIGTIGDSADNSYHVVYGSGISSAAILDGFTITSGKTFDDGGSAFSNGGGLCLSGASPTITNCIFAANSALFNGGGIYNFGGSPTLTNCAFTANSAGDSGGGMMNWGGSPTITNCIFASNAASKHGGGMGNENATPTLINCVFTSNSVVGTDGNLEVSGGGVFNNNDMTFGTYPIFNNCSFTGNTASRYGGGMDNHDSSPKLVNCTFTSNFTTGTGGMAGGGGMYNFFNSSPTLTNCAFNGNSGDIGGGVSNNYYSLPAFTNCTFTANSASFGGGMQNYHGASPTLTNCTFAGNSANNNGGLNYGGGVDNSNSSTSTLVNCILWANTGATSGMQINNGSGGGDLSMAVVTNSDIQGGWTGLGNINTDPQFVRNPSTGDYGNLNLQFTSPCIDAGNNAAVPTGITTDLAGNPRSFDIPWIVDSGSGTAPIVDMGAYEAQRIITLSSGSVPENQPAGTAIGIYNTVDSGGDSTFTYSLVTGTGSTDNASFTISGSTLKTTGSFDYETRSSYNIRVRSTDEGGLYTEKVFTITVTNVNETPTDIALSSASVAENQASGTTVGTLSTTDPDVGNTFTYTLVSGTGSTDNASFTISGSTLKTTGSFDYETRSSYNIRVRSTDEGGLYTEKVFTITVTNVNETPTDIALSSASVAENQASGTTVGTLSTTDPDVGNTFTYTLVSGTGSTDNASFTISGSTLKTTGSFDYETRSSYNIRVRSTDEGGLYTEKVFTITVTNVNETPTDIALSSASVAENQASGTTVGTLSTTDPDTSGTFTYTLVSGTGDTDNGSFTIAGNVLLTAAVFNYSAKSSYSIRVRTSDSGGMSFEKVMTLTVTQVLKGSIKGKAYNDADADGVLDKGEKPLAKVQVYLDANNNRKYDNGETLATTDGSGQYSFTGLVAGNYAVRLYKVPSGFRTSSPATGSGGIALGSGVNLTDQSILLTQKSQISGTVFLDKNKNKKKDAGESGLSGWSVFIDADKDGVLDKNETRVLTDASGNFSLNLSAGTFALGVVAKKGYKITTPSKGLCAIRVKSGNVANGKLFGAVK